MRSLIRYTALVGLVAACVAPFAASPAQANDEVTFTVIVVKATNDGNSMDPSLQKYAHLLKGKGYTNFTKLRSTSLKLAKGASGTVQIAGSIKAILTYNSEVNDRIAFKCQVLKGSTPQASLGYAVPRGNKTVVVISGNPGYMLIIKVS